MQICIAYGGRAYRIMLHNYIPLGRCSVAVWPHHAPISIESLKVDMTQDRISCLPCAFWNCRVRAAGAIAWRWDAITLVVAHKSKTWQTKCETFSLEYFAGWSVHALNCDDNFCYYANHASLSVRVRWKCPFSPRECIAPSRAPIKWKMNLNVYLLWNT